MNWHFKTLDKLKSMPTRQVLLRHHPPKEAGATRTYVIRWSTDEDVLYDIEVKKSPYDAFAEIEP